MADAPDSKSGGGNIVWVQVPPPAPNKNPRGYDENRSCADFFILLYRKSKFLFLFLSTPVSTPEGISSVDFIK